MKSCPYCGAQYSNDEILCATDACQLQGATERSTTRTPAKHQKLSWRFIRGSIAVILGLLWLAATLPCTGGIIPGPPHEGMWRLGSFMFYPGSLFVLLGVVSISTGCTLYGLVRKSAVEVLGWFLLGTLVVLVVLNG